MTHCARKRQRDSRSLGREGQRFVYVRLRLVADVDPPEDIQKVGLCAVVSVPPPHGTKGLTGKRRVSPRLRLTSEHLHK